MNLLRIEQTYGKVGVETQNSQLRVSSRQNKLQMNQTHAKIEIDRKLPQVYIDQRECFATAGLKNYYELTREAAQQGMQQAMEYTSRYAADGDALARIEYGGNPIAEIALRNSYTEHEFNIDLIPKVRPKIEFDGHLRFSMRRGEINTQMSNEGLVRINFTEPKIRVYVAQQPSIRIQYVGSNIDTYA